MLVNKLRSLGVTSDALQIAGLASIGGSIVTWKFARSAGDRAHAERFGIFIGLWAPTFFTLANQLVAVEANDG